MVKSDTKVATKKANPSKHDAPKKSNGKLNPSQQKILDLVAGLKCKLGKEEASRKQVFSMAKLGKSTFLNALKPLKDTELMIVTPQTLTITAAGMEKADPDSLGGEIAMTNKDHHKNIMEHYKLKPKAIELIDELADGRVKNKKETAKNIGMKMNSTFSNLMTDLKKKEIIVFDRETIQLHDSMFPFGRPE